MWACGRQLTTCASALQHSSGHVAGMASPAGHAARPGTAKVTPAVLCCAVLCCAGLGWAAWAVLCCAGLGWAGVGWAGLGWAGLGCAVLCCAFLCFHQVSVDTQMTIPTLCQHLNYVFRARILSYTVCIANNLPALKARCITS